jgi:hypothetical protein
MSIAMINPEPPQPKGKFLVSDHRFCTAITRKYGRFKQPRYKYPSLIFLIPPTLQPTILQYFLMKNRNIPPGNRNVHFQQHQDFVIRLFLHLSPLLPGHAAPASAASAASPARVMMEKIYHLMNMSHPTPHPNLLFQSWVNNSNPTAFPRQITLPAESHHPVLPRLITTQFHQPLSSQVVNAIVYQRVLAFPGRNEIYTRSLPSKSQPDPAYIYQRFFTNSNISNVNMLIETTQKPVKEIQHSNTHTNTYTHVQPHTSTPASSQPALVTPEAAMLFPRLRPIDFYHARLSEITGQPFTGFSNTLHMSLESAPAAGKRQSISKQAIPGPGNEQQRFLQDIKTLNMFINANQRLLKKINFRLPGKIEMSHPTAAILPRLMTTGFYHTEHTSPGFSKIDRIYREPKSTEEKQPNPGQAIPGSQYQYQWFFHDGKTLNMFINANQRLLKKINFHLPGKIEMTHPTAGILPRVMTTHFYHTGLTEHRFPGSWKIDGIYRESKPAAGRQPSKPTQPGPGVGLSPEQSGSAVPAHTSLFDTVVAKRLITPLHHFTNILKMHAKRTSFWDDAPKERHQADREWVGGATPLFINILKKHAKRTSFWDDAPKERHQADREWVGGATPLFKKISHEENTIMKKMTVEKTAVDTHPFSTTQLPADLHHFSPLNRVESDLKEAGTIKGVTAVDKNPEAAAGFKEKSNIASPGFTQNTTINLNQLTDQVYRMLERKIRTEKERRGW